MEPQSEIQRVRQQAQSEPMTSPARRGFVQRISRKVTTQDGWFGGYDYSWLCLPTLPWPKRSHEPPFYALDADLPLLLAIASGLQHALAMLAGQFSFVLLCPGNALTHYLGLITPPIIFASALNLDSATSSYMISASLIGCGTPTLLDLLVPFDRDPLTRHPESGTNLTNSRLWRVLLGYRIDQRYVV